MHRAGTPTFRGLRELVTVRLERTVSIKRARIRETRFRSDFNVIFISVNRVKNVLIFYRIFRRYIRRQYIRYVHFVRPDTLNSPDHDSVYCSIVETRFQHFVCRRLTAASSVNGDRLAASRTTHIKRVHYFHRSFVGTCKLPPLPILCYCCRTTV